MKIQLVEVIGLNPFWFTNTYTKFETFMEYFGGPQTRYKEAPQWVNFSLEWVLPKNIFLFHFYDI